MRFAEHLRKNRTPEWYSQYIEYDEMKNMLYEALNEAEQTIDINNETAREQFFSGKDERFFQSDFASLSEIFSGLKQQLTNYVPRLLRAFRLFQPLKYAVHSMVQDEQLQSNSNSTVLHRIDAEHIGYNINSNQRVLHDDSPSSDAAQSWLKRLRSNKTIKSIQKFRKEQIHDRQKNNLKSATSEFYLMLVLLKNYQMLNATGFQKILKKHDKLFQTTRGDEWWKSNIESTPFHTSNQIEHLMAEVENLYTNGLESGNRTNAIRSLRVPPLDEKQSHIVTFRVGLFLGMLCLLIPIAFALGYLLHESRSQQTLAWRPALHLYRSSFLIILHIIFVGINIYGWSHAGVNHVLIFEIDPRNHLTYQQLLEMGTFFMVVWFLSFISFIISSYYDARPFAQPLVFVVFFIIAMVNPFRIFYYQSRIWFLKKLGRVFLAPLFHVDFVGFWLGDQLTSLDLVFFDLQYFICFYSHDIHWNQPTEKHGVICSGWGQLIFQTIFALLPSWFRFAQCLRRYHDTKAKFPHLANAGKYASGFLVTITNTLRRANIVQYQYYPAANPFLYLWIISCLIGSIYKLTWDLKMDFGFFDKNAGENKFLREQIIYSSKMYYYAAILENMIFRFTWIINIFLYFETAVAEYADIIGFVFGIIEVFRRFVWNYFRLENEHLNNCGEFRAVREISIQTAVSVASGYSTRLERLGTRTNIPNQHSPKRHSQIISETEMVTMGSSRGPTFVNETFVNESVNLETSMTETNINRIQNPSTRAASVVNITSDSHTAALINPLYA